METKIFRFFSGFKKKPSVKKGFSSNFFRFRA